MSLIQQQQTLHIWKDRLWRNTTLPKNRMDAISSKERLTVGQDHMSFQNATQARKQGQGVGAVIVIINKKFRVGLSHQVQLNSRAQRT